jgi:serine/threonine protein phosphatase PrpC
VVTAQGELVCAVADGLGHGEEAARPARAACAYVQQHPCTPLPEMVQACHQELRHTRGAALAIVRIRLATGELEHVGIGNVEVISRARSPIRPVSVPGIVGASVRKVRVSSFAFHPGDVVAICSDGVSSRADLDQLRGLDPQVTAETVIQRWGKDHDDVTCVVIHG